MQIHQRDIANAQYAWSATAPYWLGANSIWSHLRLEYGERQANTEDNLNVVVKVRKNETQVVGWAQLRTTGVSNRAQYR
jgi:hypothetical protein